MGYSSGIKLMILLWPVAQPNSGMNYICVGSIHRVRLVYCWLVRACFSLFSFTEYYLIIPNQPKSTAQCTSRARWLALWIYVPWAAPDNSTRVVISQSIGSKIFLRFAAFSCSSSWADEHACMHPKKKDHYRYCIKCTFDRTLENYSPVLLLGA